LSINFCYSSLSYDILQNHTHQKETRKHSSHPMIRMFSTCLFKKPYTLDFDKLIYAGKTSSLKRETKIFLFFLKKGAWNREVETNLLMQESNLHIVLQTLRKSVNKKEIQDLKKCLPNKTATFSSYLPSQTQPLYQHSSYKKSRCLVVNCSSQKKFPVY